MVRRMVHIYQQAYRGLSPSVWLLAGVMLINRCGTMVLPFMTLYLTQHLHYSVTDAGVVMAVYGLGAFVGTFFGGRLTDRFGFYYVQLISLLLSGLFLLVLQLVTDFYLLCGSVFIFTLFGDAFRPANQAAIAYYSEPETRTRAYSLNRLAINLGWAIGGGLGGWLASVDYRLLFWADGLTCLLAGVVLWFNLPVPDLPTEGSLTEPLPLPISNGTTHLPVEPIRATPYRDSLFIAFVICTTLYFTVFMQLFTIVPLFFKEVFQLSERLIGSLMALNGLLIVFFEMALVYSIEQRKWPRFHVIITGVLLTAASFLLLTIPVGPQMSGPLIALIYIVFGTFSEMLAMPFFQSFVIERATPATRGRYLALYAMGGALAQTVAPAFGSLMVTRVGFSMHWLALVGISLVSAGGFWWLSSQFNRPQISLSLQGLKSERVNK